MTIRTQTFAALLLFTLPTVAQKSQAPATDASAQASPATSSLKPAANVNDSAAQASPAVGPATGSGRTPSLSSRASLPIRVSQRVDSSKLKNGDTVAATLASAVGSYASGTPVELSVIATVPAGKLQSSGEFSLQVTRVGKSSVFTETQTFRGQPGHKDLPDSAPAQGTDAVLDAGASLTFHVQPSPVAATTAPSAKSNAPGSVDGRAAGEVSAMPKR